MTQISKKAYKGLPVSIKVRKPHYYYQDFLEVFNDNTEKYIELREFEGLDYNFNRSQVIFDEKVLWNGYTSNSMSRVLAPSGETYLTSVDDSVISARGCLDNITDVANERELTAFVKDDEILLSESGDDREGYTWANKVTIPQHEVVPVYKKKFSETNTNYKYTYQDENILVSLNPSGELVLSEPLVFSFIPQTSFFDYDVRFTAKVTPVDATSNRVICVKDGVWFGTYNGKVVVDNVLVADVALTANNTYWVRMAETYSVSTGKYILRVAYIVDNGYTKETLPDESEWVVKSIIRDVPFFSNESTIATFGWTSNSYSWYGTMDLTNIWVDYGNITNIGDNTRIYETKWEMLEKV
ncbi:MAG: hypothetical protein IJZ30_00855 [Alphaproteobacteria bacterium]|nr:hypothetical protein [Alphaproteobacteria bacterium]